MQFYKSRLRRSVTSVSLTTLLIAGLILLNVIASIWMISTRYNSKKPMAFVTFSNSDHYSTGIAALAQSLHEVKSKYPLIAMVTPQVSQDKKNLLSDLGCIVRLVHELDLPEELSLETKRWGPAFSKLITWQFEEYSKLIFLDTDTLVLKNIDVLFLLEDMLHATVDADASSCTFKPERLKLINSGVLVLQPQQSTYDAFMSILFDKEILAKGPLNDQDVITYVLPWQGLPYPTYGAQVTHCECEDDIRMWDNDTIKLVHFTAGLRKLPKPWDYNAERDKDISVCLRKLFNRWNTLYDNALKRATRKT